MHPIDRYKSKRWLKLFDYFKTYVNQLIGSEDEFPYEQRIFNLVLILTILADLAGIISNFFVGLKLVINIIMLGSAVVFSILYYLSRFKNKGYLIFLAITFMLTLSPIWFLTEGTRGSIPLFYLLALIITISIAKTKEYWLYFMMYGLNVVLLVVLERNFFHTLITEYPNEILRQKDVNFAYSMIFIIVFLFLYLLKLRLNEERTALEKAKKSKDKFFAIVSHDLRNPLNSIVGFTEMMTSEKRNDSPEKLKFFASLVNQSAKSAYHLLDNLTAWEKANQKGIENRPKPLKLSSIVNNCRDLYKNVCSQKELTFINNIDENYELIADEQLLQLIYRNLISNSIKFTEKGGSIELSAQRTSHGKMHLSIKDSGIGMSDEIKANIFDLDSNKNRLGLDGEASSGLGLYLCHEAIKQMDGELLLESSPGKGTTFTIVLPDLKA